MVFTHLWIVSMLMGEFDAKQPEGESTHSQIEAVKRDWKRSFGIASHEIGNEGASTTSRKED